MTTTRRTFLLGTAAAAVAPALPAVEPRMIPFTFSMVEQFELQLIDDVFLRLCEVNGAPPQWLVNFTQKANG